MNRYDSISSVIWFLAALGIVIWSSLTLKLGTLRHPGPAFLPLLSGLIVAFLAMVVFLQSKRTEKGERCDNFFPKGFLPRIFGTIGILIFYVLLLERLGFIPSTFILMFFVVKVVAGRSWWTGIVESSIATGASYLIFSIFLKIPLPRGWLGI